MKECAHRANYLYVVLGKIDTKAKPYQKMQRHASYLLYDTAMLQIQYECPSNTDVRAHSYAFSSKVSQTYPHDRPSFETIPLQSPCPRPVRSPDCEETPLERRL